jgi:AcrR family transcriptional regulator
MNPSEFSEKQIQILDVAEQLFATKGFDGTSVRDIAQEAGVNIAMISYYFGSKEKLLEAVFEHRTAYLRSAIENMLLNNDVAPLNKIYSLIDHFVDKVMTQQPFHTIMAREPIGDKDSVIKNLMGEAKRRNYELIKKLIGEGQRKGAFKKNIDIPFMMMTMVGTANQLLTAQHHYKELSNLQSMPEEEFQEHIRKKLSTHLKRLFKAILSNEE